MKSLLLGNMLRAVGWTYLAGVERHSVVAKTTTQGSEPS